jgi:hypothetical protein
MPDDIIDLRSVNWSQGMFLTPDHFIRQERYFDSALLWMMRYASAAAGLVGGGPRVQPSEYGAASYDPIVDFDDSGDELKITVTQCRGVTPAGALVEVQPARAIKATFPRRELEGVLEVGVWVIAKPHDKEPDEGVDDPINPVMQTGKRFHYRISLDPGAEDAPWSLLLIRLRRSENRLRFERVGGFIPACAYMSAHSELMQAFRRVTERISTIADHYSGLHRAIVDFVGMAKSRQLNVDQDAETLAFVSRMVVILEDCAYRILDPLQPPRQFFRETTQLIRGSALFLSLSPPTREYFRMLGEIGDTEFVAMLEQEGEALEMGRQWVLADDLGVEAGKVLRALDRLERLEQALEGKYMDYRISPSLESINFVFDRTSGEVVLYQTVARPSRPQAMGQQLTFVFAPLNLEAREQYRLILVGDRKAHFKAGDSLATELRINPGTGYERDAEYHTTAWEVNGQCNFAVDFSAPSDVINISDVRVSVRTTQPIRSAILYVRKRLMGGLSMSPSPSPRQPVVPRPIAPPRPPVVQPRPVAPPEPRQDPRTDPRNDPRTDPPGPPTPRKPRIIS